MPNWNDVLQETIQQQQSAPVDIVRRKYLARLYEKTQRNVIAYYSGWIEKPNFPSFVLGISDQDMGGFMSVIHKLDRSRGLDLILHTPGGNIAATEALVEYLWRMFERDMRVIVPQIAMSAGTMVACAAKTIVMGKHSNLGPIDPQIGSFAAQAVLKEFKIAAQQIHDNPETYPVWKMVIEKYPASFFVSCLHAIALSDTLTKRWLLNNMFADEPQDVAMAKADNITKVLNDHSESLVHERHFSVDYCRALGLNIQSLEEDDELQDLVLTVHHAYAHTFSQTKIVKIIENHDGVAMALLAA
ncbi:MAG: hypothetical protein H7837_04610 [Magnetococcus sp. MYC-9]